LVPFVEPRTKDLVTTPVAGLRSLSTCSSSVQPLFYLHGFSAPIQATVSRTVPQMSQSSSGMKGFKKPNTT
ncbi:hypothetical protein GOODEAATRI_021479, partial [Goodea atripinnis]